MSDDWAQRIEDAQTCHAYIIGGGEYPRIPYGQEKRGGIQWHLDREGNPQSCHDCAVQVGQYHVPGCDVEECPKCGGQAIGCGCDDD